VSEDAVVCREMGCTRAEFLSWLPDAVRGAKFRIQDNRIHIGYGGGEVLIEIDEGPERRIGRLVLPVLLVCTRFSGVDEGAREEFLRHFDLATRRGGG